MDDRINDSSPQLPFINGTVVERKGSQVRLKIEDEDGVISPWINIPSRAGSKTPAYDMPDLGDQYAALIDWDGGTGVGIGSIFNKEHPAPSSNPDERVEIFGDTKIVYNKKTGEMHISGSAKKIIEGGEIILKGDVKVEGSITCNSVDISDTHKHKDVVVGTATSGTPA